MEEIISNSTKTKIAQNDKAAERINVFKQCYGITKVETDRLKPLNDVLAGKYTQQGQAVWGIFQNEVTTPWYKRAYERRYLCKQFRTEGLEAEKDACEVINSCQHALNKVYDIRTPKAVCVSLRHKCRREKLCVEIGEPKVSIARKILPKKFSRQSEPDWVIRILYGSPRILLMAEFLKKCFLEELGVITKKEEVDKDEENSGEQEKAETGENKAENDDYWEKESQKIHLTVWLVSNCLYTLGELVYAEQYIVEYQESSRGDVFKELCEKLGVPWTVMGRPIREILDVLEDKKAV